MGLYIAKSNPASAYGAGGVIIIVMLWTYFSTLILLFGAQYTYVSSGAADKQHIRNEDGDVKELPQPADA
jgi:membrane protein